MSTANPRKIAAPSEAARPIAGRAEPILHSWVIGLILLVVTVVLYWPVRNFEFINYDDQDYVSENFQVQAGLTSSSLVWAFKATHASNWHPLTWLSHMLDCQLFGLNAGRQHLSSVLLHSVNALLLFLVLKRFTGALWPSAMVAALFAWHPSHVESVAWISERKDVLSTFFGFLTLLAYSFYVRESGSQFSVFNAGSSRRSRAFYGLTLLSFVLCLMSKPMWVTLPVLLLLLDVWPLRRLPLTKTKFQAVWPLVSEKLPFLVLSAASSIMTVIAQHQGGAIKSLESLSLSARLANALVSYARYLGKIFWPTDLALPYPYPGGWPWTLTALATSIVVGLSLVAIWSGKKRPYVLVGWFWFLAMLVPVIGIVQVGAQAMADRYTYVPSVGIFFILAWGAAEIANRWTRLQPILALVGLSLAGACAFRTVDQLSYWRDSGTLAAHAVAVTRNNDIAYSNLGNFLLENGKLDDAIDNYKKALRTMWIGGEMPDDPVAALTGTGSERERQLLLRADPRKVLACVEILNNLGTALARKDRVDDGIALYRLTLQLKPDHALALHNLAFELAARKEYTQAIELYEAAIRAKPDQPHMRNSFGNALVEVGRVDEAMVQYETARRLAPKDAQTQYNLGLAFSAQGNVAQAIVHYETALEFDPKMIEVHNQLGSALLRAGRLDDAIQHFRVLLQQKPDHARAHDNLGVALAAKGQLVEATAQLQESLRFDADNPNTHFNLGNVFALQRRFEQAAEQYREALRTDPNLAKAHCHLGATLAELGRRDEAIRHLRQALQLDPNYEAPRQQLRLLGVDVP